jgi:retron-type reverse transcriptase
MNNRGSLTVVNITTGIVGGHHSCNFSDVISIDNLLLAWRGFRKGKRSKPAVINFELKLEENILSLYQDLICGLWEPKPYKVFYTRDPKLRQIHEADIRDMVLYQAVYQKLYQVFDATFIFDSYSSRKTKGTHAGVKRFEGFANKVTQNYTRAAYALKCDLRKFFDSIDHEILLELIARKIDDYKLFNLIKTIILSFEKSAGKGLPLGNVTSQLFANIYLNELDQFIKHNLKAKYYIRYCDDFVVLSDSTEYLNHCLNKIEYFCAKSLSVNLHPGKIEIRKLKNGVDFLGYVSLPRYRVLRTKTKRRMLKRISAKNAASYLGMLTHCKGKEIKIEVNKTISQKSHVDEIR